MRGGLGALNQRGKPIPGRRRERFEVGFMSAHKQIDRLPWEKIVIALALLAAGAWILGWLAGKIVIFFVVK